MCRETVEDQGAESGEHKVYHDKDDTLHSLLAILADNDFAQVLSPRLTPASQAEKAVSAIVFATRDVAREARNQHIKSLMLQTRLSIFIRCFFFLRIF